MMREAEDAVALAFAVMGNARPGGKDLWPGAWGEYRKLGATLCRIRKLRARADAWERWNTPPNVEFSGGAPLHGAASAGTQGSASPPTRREN